MVANIYITGICYSLTAPTTYNLPK